ncbi:hypothetical protein JHK82_050563 [Glycine max]|nr:hypothetical protein JHK85_051274 [Glycine max]KAG5091785.1 hypothetical protein JHK82_050563 [Glycine max]KAG5094885.1 hypothetical protein JHK84_050473 [Glycine max]
MPEPWTFSAHVKIEGERRNTSHGLGVVSVAANPLGFVTASSSLDNFVRVFNVNSNATIATLKAPPFEVEVWKMHFDPKVSYKNSATALVKEVRGFWPNLLITVLFNKWRKCKRAMESSYPPKEPKCILFPSQMLSSEALHQLQIFTLGRYLLEKPLIYPPGDLPANSRAQTSGLDVSGPKPRTEFKWQKEDRREEPGVFGVYSEGQGLRKH